MDNICEQNVQKAKTKGDTVKIVLILTVAAVVAAACVFFGIIMGIVLIMLIPAFGVGALGVWLTGNLYIEYEYILTNNEMDVDKIIGKRTRKRMITVDISKSLDFEAYPPKGEISYDAVVYAGTGLSNDAACLLTEHTDYGKVLVVFNPNKKMREAMAQEMPRDLRSKVTENE